MSSFLFTLLCLLLCRPCGGLPPSMLTCWTLSACLCPHCRRLPLLSCEGTVLLCVVVVAVAAAVAIAVSVVAVSVAAVVVAVCVCVRVFLCFCLLACIVCWICRSNVEFRAALTSVYSLCGPSAAPALEDGAAGSAVEDVYVAPSFVCVCCVCIPLLWLPTRHPLSLSACACAGHPRWPHRFVWPSVSCFMCLTV